MSSYVDRIIRAAKLDPRLYEEVEADRSAMGQAAGVVLLSSLAAGISHISVAGFGGLVRGAVAALIGWLVWAFLVYLIGTKLLPEPQTRSDMGELLRTIGFASAPGLIRVIGIIPLLGWLIGFIAAVWTLVAMVIAVRQALDYKSTLRAVVVCIIGWVVQLIILMIPLLFMRNTI
jgi:hypothetical protein